MMNVLTKFLRKNYEDSSKYKLDKNKIYLISFDPEYDSVLKLNKVIKNNKHIVDWWHYLHSTYIIAAPYPLTIVKDDILKQWRNNFFIVEIGNRSYGGFLPECAWPWLEKNIISRRN